MSFNGVRPDLQPHNAVNVTGGMKKGSWAPRVLHPFILAKGLGVG